MGISSGIVVSRDTVLSCLALLSGSSSIQLKPPPFWRRQHRRPVLPIETVVEIASGLGLAARWVRLDWKLLQFSLADHPVLLILKNTNAVVAIGIAGHDNDAIFVADPLHLGDVLRLRRSDVEHAWAGEALTIAKPAAMDDADVIDATAPEPQQRSGESCRALASFVSHSSAPRSPRRPLSGSIGRSLRIACLAGFSSVALIRPTADPGAGPREAGWQFSSVTASPVSNTESAPQPTQAVSVARPDQAAIPDAPSEPAAISARQPSLERVAAFANTGPAPGSSDLEQSSAPAAPPPSPPEPEPAVTPAVPRAGPRRSADLAALVAQGDRYLERGDVGPARLFYRQAAEDGGALAALRLGETYDPLFLELARLRGVPSDLDQSILWYRRARDLGSAEAASLLKSLHAN
jgi:hypothetical protein